MPDSTAAPSASTRLLIALIPAAMEASTAVAATTIVGIKEDTAVVVVDMAADTVVVVEGTAAEDTAVVDMVRFPLSTIYHSF